jgi:hypothetical protein
VAWRGFACLVLLLALCNPRLLREERETRPDVALLLVDQSDSAKLGQRAALIAAARAALEARAARLAGMELRVVEVPETGQRGTALFSALSTALANVPRARLAGIIALVTTPSGQPDPLMYFWITGLLSSFLDNAPTYLVFFNAAGADPIALMGPMASTLMAISMGAVFMGANSYIGNAPNFMVYSIAREAGVAMPSFFGYMLWSGALLVPLFGLVHFFFL